MATNFISDDDMIKLEETQANPAPSNIISDSEMAELEASQPSKLESATRGIVQGATAGFADEVSGGMEALWEAAKGNPTTFGELYKAKRDESRANFKKAEEANPKTYMAGQLGGAVGTGIATGGAGLGALVAQGAAQGLGSSEADLTEGEFGEALKDTATGAGTAAILGGASKAVGGLASKLGSAANKGLAVGREVLEDVATAPMTQSGAEMGKVAKTLGTIGKVGDKFDDFTSMFTKNVAPTGNEVADKVVNQLAKKGSYAIPGVGKVVAAADVASSVPSIAQGAANLALRGGRTIADNLPEILKTSPQLLGKFAIPLQQAAERGGTSLAATHFILSSTNPEYRSIVMPKENENEE